MFERERVRARERARVSECANREIGNLNYDNANKIDVNQLANAGNDFRF